MYNFELAQASASRRVEPKKSAVIGMHWVGELVPHLELVRLMQNVKMLDV